MKSYYKIDKSFRSILLSFGKSYPEIVKGCDLLIITLKDLKIQAHKSTTFDFLEDALEDCLDNFSYCKKLADGTISQDEWEDFDFDGDVMGLFNDYMNDFWDICDTKEGSEDTQIRFCWVDL